MSQSPAIEINQLSYAYRSDWLLKRVTCLHQVDLTVKQGEAFGFLGHNGAGKTTTIKCLLNLIWPRSGSIKLFGIDSRLVESRKSVGYLPEQPYFYDHLTVYETIQMYAALAGIAKAEIRQSCLEALDQVNMQGRLKSRMRTLSKGLTQRVALAQAIVAKPRLLIMDEPFSGLDPLGRREFSDIFAGLKKEGTTLFISSHILSDVQALCDRFSIMVKGQLKGVFTMQDVASLMPGVYELIIRMPAGDLKCLPTADKAVHTESFASFKYADPQVAQLALQNAIKNNLAVDSFQFTHGGLEELFVKLVKDDVQGVSA